MSTEAACLWSDPGTWLVCLDVHKEWLLSGIVPWLLGVAGAAILFAARWFRKRRPDPPTAAAEATPTSLPNLRKSYLNLMAADWRILPLEVLDPDAADAAARRITLDQVYIVLDTTSPRPEALRPKGRDEELRMGREEPLSAVEALCHADRQRMVLLGQPGSGKSTFARHLALNMAEVLLAEPGTARIADRLPGWTGAARIPVFVSLGRLAGRMGDDETGTAQQVMDFIGRQVNGRQTLNGYGEALLTELEETGGLVIFDGLDEVDGSRRLQVKQAVSEFAELHQRCVVLVTCRVHSYKQDAGWQLEWAAEHTLADFDPPKIESFIDGWYDAQSRLNPGSAIDYDDKKQTLKQGLDPDDPRGLRDLAGTPLLLTVMAIVHTRKELPGSRVGVYRECVEILLDRWQGAREGDVKRRPLLDALRPYGVTPRNLAQGLRKVAHDAHASPRRPGTGGRALVSGDIISGVMKRFLGSAEALEVFMNYCRHANGLLMAERVVTAGDDKAEPFYVFPHLSFEEYLAARYLRDQERECIQESVALAGDPAWWEVVRFLGEYLCHDEEGGNISLARALLEELCPPAEPERDEDWRRVWLAGTLLKGFQDEAVHGQRNEALEDRIVQRLVALLENDSALGQAPQDRAAVGRALVRVGDPRPFVGLDENGRPDFCWARIPGTGTVRASGQFPAFAGFKMGNGLRKDPEAYDDETWPEGKPAFEIADFELAVYPVTAAQYRPFVDEGGYREDRYWSDEGKEVRDAEEWRAPARWDDSKWTSDNHPVVGVSWFEAQAYINWINERLAPGQAVRLPTEAEWEWAARGPEGRRYPWGDASPQGRCNYGDTSIGRTCAVGVSPLGAGGWWQDLQLENKMAPMDLAGNVWEWTGSEWAEDYSESDRMSKNHAGGDRVLRGGAWFGVARDVRAAGRDGWPLGVRTSDVGFRLARTLTL